MTDSTVSRLLALLLRFSVFFVLQFPSIFFCFCFWRSTKISRLSLGGESCSLPSSPHSCLLLQQPLSYCMNQQPRMASVIDVLSERAVCNRQTDRQTDRRTDGHTFRLYGVGGGSFQIAVLITPISVDKYHVRLCTPINQSINHIQGGPKKWGHYVWRLKSLHAHIFKMPKQISVIFGLLQRRYILNTYVDSIFIKFIIHVRAFLRCGHAKIWAFKRSGLTFLDHPVDIILRLGAQLTRDVVTTGH